jgi:hypoxanthine-DNA glycosylase
MGNPEFRLQGLPPVINSSCRKLVLGSMPGGLSLSRKQYYGNPRNHFWRLLAAVFGEKSGIGDDYELRLNFALAQGLGLWDVLAACERAGSLDANIRKPEANDFISLLKGYPRLERIFFNGQAAEQLYRRHVMPLLVSQGMGAHIQYFTLPSSSPARAIPVENKLKSWRVLADSED